MSTQLTTAAAFDEAARLLAVTPVRVFQKGDIKYVVKYQIPEDLERTIKRISDEDMHCRECSHRAVKYAPLVGPDGPVFLSGVDTSSIRDPKFSKLRGIVCDIPDPNVMPKVLLVGSNTFAPLQSGSRLGIPFKHWTVKPDSTCADGTNMDLLMAVVKKYVRMEENEMLTGMVSWLLESPQMVESVNLFKICLGKAHRCEIYQDATDWMMKIQSEADGRLWSQMTGEEKIHIVMFALSEAKIQPGFGSRQVEDASVPMFHQANNAIRSLLERASDEESMVRLINDMTDPIKYQRKTAGPSTGQMEVGMKMLGEFENTVMKCSDLQKYGHNLVMMHGVGWEEGKECVGKANGETTASPLQEGERDLRARAGGFASRANATKGVTSVARLVEILRDGRRHELLVDASEHTPVVLADTTLDKTKLRDGIEHLWGFYISQKLSGGWGGTAEMNVIAVISIPSGLFFLCQGTHIPNGLAFNFNFPENLCPGMQAAKTAYEATNKLSHAIIPEVNEGDHLAIGMCAQPTTAARKLIQNVGITLDGNKYVLETMD